MTPLSEATSSGSFSGSLWTDYRRIVARLMPPLALGDGVPEAGYAARRSPVNSLFFDFSSSAPDQHASSSTLYVGLEPSAVDAPVEQRAVQAISGASAAGTGMRVGTDVGCWEFE
jgi:hypothetical protein